MSLDRVINLKFRRTKKFASKCLTVNARLTMQDSTYDRFGFNSDPVDTLKLTVNSHNSHSHYFWGDVVHVGTCLCVSVVNKQNLLSNC